MDGIFANRTEAGQQLGQALRQYRGLNVIVIGLPRGGVSVAAQVAKALQAPLDIAIVRKLGVPFQPELAMGAIGEGDVRAVNFAVVRNAHVNDADFRKVETRERAELDRRVALLRADNPALDVSGATVIVVDDGVATGSTAKAACRILRARGAKRIIFAAPVGPPDVASVLRPDADRVVCLVTPRRFAAVGQCYSHFDQVTDEEVRKLLTLARGDERSHNEATTADPPAAPLNPDMDVDMDLDMEMDIPAGSLRLAGHLTRPADAVGLVIFAHGSGSSRHSPRNRSVAAALNARGLATLLFDLLTTEEETARRNVFDIELLARRLLDVTDWAAEHQQTAGLPIGYFGASTGAAAALLAAATAQAESGPSGRAGHIPTIRAIVSRGGRPDLAGAALPAVHAPTLLIVGGSDRAVLDLNRLAQTQLRCSNRLEVVPRATHLFEEPGALDEVARLAGDWFINHLPTVPARSTVPTVPTTPHDSFV